ncbi:MAG: hypothetical protein Q8P31_00425 [Bacillota bacterium]|nr:hypothetical protein [Bacillota bacterium]
MLGSHLRQAKQASPALGTVEFDAPDYEARIRPLVSLLKRETNRFELDGPNALFVDFAGGGDPAQAIKGLAADGFGGFELVAGLAASKFVARAAVLALLGAVSDHERPMFMFPTAPQAVRINVDHGRTTHHCDNCCNCDDGQGQGPVLTIADLQCGGRPGELAFLATLPVGYMWPATEETRERLYRLGLKTCGDVGRVNRLELSRLFGAEGHRLADLAQGQDQDCVCPSYSRDEIVRRVDFDGPISGKLALKSSLQALGEDLGQSLRAEFQGCRSLTLILRLDDGLDLTRERIFSRPQGDPRTLGAAVTAMLEGVKVHRPVLGVEVIGAGLDRDPGRQLSFLPEAVSRDQQSNLLRTVSFLERRFPGGVVRIGTAPASRRERMLALIDPVRRHERGAPAD